MKVCLNYHNLGYNPKNIEIGKPNLDKDDMNISNEDKILVIGDNPKTDGLLAFNNKFDYSNRLKLFVTTKLPDPVVSIFVSPNSPDLDCSNKIVELILWPVGLVLL